MPRRSIAIAALVLSVFASSTSAQNCAPFTDVLASSSFCGNIQWLHNRGITQGCAQNQYCPADFVRRDQMAAFLNRLADNLFPLTCATGQVMRWSGSAWVCAGSLTSLSQGTGIVLTPNPVVATGTVAADTTYLQRRVTGTCGSGSSIRTINADGSVVCEVDDGAANAFVQGGNAFGTTAVLGTSDNQALEIRVNGARVMRYEPNAISPNVIGGSPANSVTAGVRGATIAGGGVPVGDSEPAHDSEAPNRVTDLYGTVGGGYANQAGDGTGTTVFASFATVAGGFGNTAGSQSSTVAGGQSNAASGIASVVGGGYLNTASNSSSTIGGGGNNTASGRESVVAGGFANTASGSVSTVGGGYGNTASGERSTVAGGLGNIAAGQGSFATGLNTRANHAGCFVYADASSINTTSCFGPNEIVIRGVGGFYFFTGGSSDASYTGAQLPAGAGAWGAYSDRNGKESIEPVDTTAVLDKLVAMPIATWQWKSEPGAIRHMGPMAQDFRRAFGLGNDDRQILTVDADGVALAAIQGLNTKLEAQLKARDAQIDAQRAEIDELRRAVETLLARDKNEDVHK